MSDRHKGPTFVHVPFYTGSLGLADFKFGGSIRGKLRPDVRAFQLAENLIEKWNTGNDPLAIGERSATRLWFYITYSGSVKEENSMRV